MGSQLREQANICTYETIDCSLSLFLTDSNIMATYFNESIFGLFPKTKVFYECKSGRGESNNIPYPETDRFKSYFGNFHVYCIIMFTHLHKLKTHVSIVRSIIVMVFAFRTYLNWSASSRCIELESISK